MYIDGWVEEFDLIRFGQSRDEGFRLLRIQEYERWERSPFRKRSHPRQKAQNADNNGDFLMRAGVRYEFFAEHR